MTVSATDEARLAEAHAIQIGRVAEMLEIGNLGRAGREMVGPCPMCGGDDRFSINLQKNLFNCRKCGSAGDQVRLVEVVRRITFRAAVDWLVGPSQELSEAERAERVKMAEAAAAERAREANAFRRRAISEARAIWQAGQPAEDTPVRDYLTRRGIDRARFPMPKTIRFDPARPYMTGAEGGRGWQELWRGPCMLAAIQGADGKFIGVHQTWIDLGQPKGKLVLPDPRKPGKNRPAKKVHGSLKGGAIRLVNGAAPRLVMGEGIETTLTALMADRVGATHWAGVSLGNMAGSRQLGPGMRYAGIPDLDDAEAFVPPEGVRDLVYLMDGDSEPRLTRAQLLAGCRRAMMRRPGLRGWIAPAPEGRDLNDLLMEGAADG